MFTWQLLGARSQSSGPHLRGQTHFTTTLDITIRLSESEIPKQQYCAGAKRGKPCRCCSSLRHCSTVQHREANVVRMSSWGMVFRSSCVASCKLECGLHRMRASDVMAPQAAAFAVWFCSKLHKLIGSSLAVRSFYRVSCWSSCRACPGLRLCAHHENRRVQTFSSPCVRLPV